MALTKNDQQIKQKKIQKPPKHFQLIKAIRGEKQGNIEGEKQLYKANINRRDAQVRRLVEEKIDRDTELSIMPGQLIMFNYLTPIHKNELEYYDAMPCTLFFGMTKNAEGKDRVLGFNLHYYPPRMRYQILNRIFNVFKPFYLKNWHKTLEKEIQYWDHRMYIMLLEQLKKQKLDFGVRMYDPKLMKMIKPIPPMYWQKVVFTEGVFKKQTRNMIMNHWQKWLERKQFNL